jgi:phage terminase large subunit-like protein
VKHIDAMSTGERVCAFIEEYCKVPEGKHVGKPITLAPFQRKFILAVYDNPAGTRRAILSMARKNGKTALIAAICMAHVAGPVAEQNSQVISGAQSRDQASLVFKLMQKMVTLDSRLGAVVRVVPSTKTIFGLRKNVEYMAISAEAKTAHGRSPIVAILDETGQVRGPQDSFVDAIETSQGAHDAPLLLVISTQAAHDSDLLSVWIDDALTGADPTFICHLYTAPNNCDLLDEVAWAAANPALGDFRSAADMSMLAKKAQRMPAFGATFRNLNLNQRIEVSSPFVTRDVWEMNSAPPESLDGQVVYGGLDLSAVSDLTALVLVSAAGDVHPTFWLPSVGLDDKAKEARAPYTLWAAEGLLMTTPGRAVEYEFIAEHLRGVFDRCDVAALAFDRAYMRFLRPWLVKAGFSDNELEKFVDFGQGFMSMAPALRDLESRLLSRRLRHGNHPVLNMCAANAVVVRDDADNRKFTKKKATGRIDGMVSLAMAVGMMPQEQTEELSYYDIIAAQRAHQ